MIPERNIMRITPRTDVLGDFTIEYLPEKHPVEKPCHVHLRWAKEKCPHCGSALMMYYAPTFKHRLGQEAVSREEAHRVVLISCVMCDFITGAPGPSIIAGKLPKNKEK